MPGRWWLKHQAGGDHHRRYEDAITAWRTCSRRPPMNVGPFVGVPLRKTQPLRGTSSPHETKPDSLARSELIVEWLRGTIATYASMAGP
jgi:hypothetical protein